MGNVQKGSESLRSQSKKQIFSYQSLTEGRWGEGLGARQRAPKAPAAPPEPPGSPGVQLPQRILMRLNESAIVFSTSFFFGLVPDGVFLCFFLVL